MLQRLSDLFWSPSIWLPGNTTWADLEPDEKMSFTNYRHLYIYPIPLALVILLVRFAIEKYCFFYLGLNMGIPNAKPRKAKRNKVLEYAYQQNSKWQQNKVVGLAKQLDLTERQVHRWLRIRDLQEKPSTLTKFCENSWRSFYYTCSFLYGLVILWDKPWFKNIDYCWLNYPHHGVSNDVWWYYMISLAFYWSLAFSQFFDVKRKDFWQMFLHHVATIMLLSFSWVCNLHRVGTLVLVIHDSADSLLDATKALHYAKYDKLCNCSFVLFILTWIVTRIIIFPTWILYSTTVRAPIVAKKMFPAYYIFNGLLILLLILHIFWTHLLFQLVHKTICSGQLERDIRSSESECENGSDNEDENENVKLPSSSVNNGLNGVSNYHVDLQNHLINNRMLED